MNTAGIVQHPHPVLRLEAARVREFDTSEVNDLADTLVEAAALTGRLGVAAPQLGVAIHGFAARTAEHTIPRAYFNAEVVWASDDEEKAWEGCLSIADKPYAVSRPRSVRVDALTAAGELVTLTAEGLRARILQHEIDHLNGRLICDYAP